MARLGIDFGTTNTVVVLSDRGHYPVVPHKVSTAAGEVIEEVFPSLIWFDAATGEWRFGLEADRRSRREPEKPSAFRISSLKRQLAAFTDGQTLDFGGHKIGVEELLTRFLSALRESILRSGFLGSGASSRSEKLECVISWPANSNGAQRHVTRRAFRNAGFDVIGSVSEPAASAVEYADRVVRGNRTQARTLRSAVAIFDLGGGTFDTSLVKIEGPRFHVLASSGIERLGGDDFDAVLLGMFLNALGIREEELSAFTRLALLRHARMEKEGISRDPDRGFLELVPADYGLRVPRAGRPVRITVDAYYEALRPMILRAAKVMENVLSGNEARKEGLDPERIEAIYLAGGSSRLPLVPYVLRKRFPATRIVLSDKPFTSVAMGAAIVAADSAKVSDVISRHFGVIRLKDCGKREYFSPIFRPGTRLPGRDEPPIEVEVDYRPQHNIGRLQYYECSEVGQNDLPQGDVRRWTEILFPYDPAIPPEAPLRPADVVPAEHLGETRVIEHYYCDADGVITVKLERRADGRQRTFEISKD